MQLSGAGALYESSLAAELMIDICSTREKEREPFLQVLP